MIIKLERPIIFFDIESTGVDIVNDRIVELYAHKTNMDGSIEEYHSYYDTDIEISEGASEVHGITKDKIIGWPKFQDESSKVFNFFKDCDLAGYNCIKFDIPMLTEELMRYKHPFNPLKCNVIDPLNILYKMEPNALSEVYKRYFGEDMTNAHSAKNDVMATIKVFEKQLDIYNLDKDVKSISKFVRSDRSGNRILDYSGMFSIKNGDYYYMLGKNKGKLVKDDMSYLNWIIELSDFAINTKMAAHAIKKTLIK